ncbi:oxidoreductase family protein [Hyaloraphidium curvatum]|nr:oxidoreductase family protein [Hyaloraphidium curvatum]
MEPVGIGYIGAGTFALYNHLPPLIENRSTAVLAGVWSRSEKSASTLAAKYLSATGTQAPVHYGPDGLDKLLADPKVEGVLVSTSISSMPEMIRRAWKAGKHVLSEKPAAPDVAAGLALLAEYEKEYRPKGIVWQVAENYRADPGVRLAASEARKLGKLRFFDMRIGLSVPSVPDWRATPDYQGGLVLDAGVHFAALARALAGTEPATVSAFSSASNPKLPPLDSVVAAVRTADGGHGVVNITVSSPVLLPVIATAVFERGAVKIEAASGGFKVTTTEAQTKGRPKVSEQTVKSGAGAQGGVREELLGFCEAVRGRPPTDYDNSAWQGVADVALIEAMLRSAEAGGKPVEVARIAAGKGARL